MEKWILRSRRLWAWGLALLGAVAAIDAALLDAIVPHLAVLLGIDQVELDGLRAKLLAAAPLAAMLLAWWRTRRPDPRELRLIPPSITDRIP